MEKISLLKKLLSKRNEYNLLCENNDQVFIVDNNGVYAFEETKGTRFRVMTVYTLIDNVKINDISETLNQLNKGCSYGKYDIQTVDGLKILSFRFNVWNDGSLSPNDKDNLEALALGCLSLARTTLYLSNGE